MGRAQDTLRDTPAHSLWLAKSLSLWTEVSQQGVWTKTSRGCLTSILVLGEHGVGVGCQERVRWRLTPRLEAWKEGESTSGDTLLPGGLINVLFWGSPTRAEPLGLGWCWESWRSSRHSR